MKNQKYTDQDLIDEIKRVYEKYNEIPSSEKWRNKKYDSNINNNTISNRFGGWNKTLEIALGITEFNKNKSVKLNCEQCGKEFTKWHSEYKKTKKHFCSQSCAATYNNKHFPKRCKTKVCKTVDCDTLIDCSYTYCEECISEGKHLPGGINLSDRTLGEYIKGRPKNSNRYRDIRRHAKKAIKERPQICNNCGYDKHIETCHIKDIKDFDLDTLISEINSKENLIFLCPNCHWEFDNGILNLSDIEIKL